MNKVVSGAEEAIERLASTDMNFALESKQQALQVCGARVFTAIESLTDALASASH